jgi:multidrug efflux pump subunit AcrA (membrane-fusion protein)
MEQPMRWWISFAVFLIAAAGLWAQFGGFGGRGGQDQTIAAEAVGPVENTERVFTTTVGGRLQPARTVAHSSSVGGIVADVRVTVGQQVEAGDVLYTIKRNDTTGSFAPVVVSARIAGVVAAAAVRPSMEIRGGEPGVTIIETHEYLMTGLISDKDAFAIQVGQSVVGRTAGGSAVRGTLIARSPEPDYQTGLFTLTFRFTDVPAVFPGQFVTVDLPVETVQGIFIAQNLLFRRYGRYYVWIVAEDNTLTTREVKAGRTHGNEIQITAGLQSGDRILLRRRGNEREGMPVDQAEG